MVLVLDYNLPNFLSHLCRFSGWIFFPDLAVSAEFSKFKILADLPYHRTPGNWIFLSDVISFLSSDADETLQLHALY